MVSAILMASLALQATAIVLALRLIPVTRARAAWIFIACAIGLMGIRRAITLGRTLTGDVAHPPDPTTELVALTISALMVAGIVLIRRVFEGHRRAEAELRASETARRDLEVRLVRAEKTEALGRLAGGVAHDFNNLLTAVIGCTDQARRALPSDHPAQPSLQAALAATERASRLSARLLMISRRQPVQLVPVDPLQVVQGVVGIYQRELPAGIELEVALPARVEPVMADSLLLEQVIGNLILNARDAMPDGGRLTVTVGMTWVEAGRGPPGARAGDYVAIAVRDTGVGLEPATLARVFEPFFTTKPPGKGTGLGLSSSEGIVSQLGGFFEVQSAPGQGSTFTVLLPRSEAPLEPPPLVPAAPPEPAAPPLAPHPVVLVVDDEPMIRKLARLALGGHGFEVLEAGDGDEALAVVRQRAGKLDLLLSDCVMPGMDGVELARAVAAERPDTRILLMSGYMAAADSPFPILTKPFGMKDLVQRVQAALAG